MAKPHPPMHRFGPFPAQPRYFPTHRPAGPGKCGPPDDRTSSERGLLGDRDPIAPRTQSGVTWTSRVEQTPNKEGQVAGVAADQVFGHTLLAQCRSHPLTFPFSSPYIVLAPLSQSSHLPAGTEASRTSLWLTDYRDYREV